MIYILAQIIWVMLEIYEAAEMWLIFIVLCFTVDFSATYRDADDMYLPGYKDGEL